MNIAAHVVQPKLELGIKNCKLFKIHVMLVIHNTLEKIISTCRV